MYEAQDKMEFTCGNYDLRLTLNPTDMILRLEHCENKRLYERTFYERDFAEVIVLGGLEFVGKVVVAKITTATFAETTSEVNFTLTFTHELLPKPLTLTFQVPAVKREKALADMEGLLARLKKMETAMTLCKELSVKVQDLEDRCGDTITLPGCDYAVSTGVTNLILIKNWGMLPDGRQFSTFYQDFYFQNNPGWSEYNPNCPFNHAQHGQNPQWSIVKNGEKAIIFNNLKSIKNLKYCKNLNSLTICGAQELSDYTLSDLKNLHTLNIIANFGLHNPLYKVKDSNPPLIDISWISNLKNLQKVSFQGCTNLVNISSLKDLPNLTEVDLRDTGVKNTGFLASSKLKIII
jgi:hypothetical protein